MPPVVAFETTEMFKSLKEVLRIASSPSVQFLTSYTFAERGFVTYTMFVFATQVCYLYVFTSQYDKSSFKMYLDE